MKRPIAILFLLVAILGWPAGSASASPREAIQSVVSILPVWPGRAQGGAGAKPGTAPEGSGVVLRPGIVATAWHVIKPAQSIEVRLRDGRILPAKLLAKDVATDIALLEIDADVQAFEITSSAQLTDPVCAIGNAYGFGLSVTCGVISALEVTNAGFNAVEDFVQTDAAINPGMSGGALVDKDGRLVGLISAIFSSKSDTNIGVNFAVSARLLLRVADALIEDGEVNYPDLGWQLQRPDRDQLRKQPAALVRSVEAEGLAARSGIREQDLILRIGDRQIRSPEDAVTALALVPANAKSVRVEIGRDGETISVELMLQPASREAATQAPSPIGECPHPKPVCQLRQAVFPLSSFDPIASATRIGERLLVTNRHVVGDRMDAVVHTPDGPRGARVIPSAYQGDLVLLEVIGLPDTGVIPNLVTDKIVQSAFYTIGADIDLQQVRVFDPGGLIANPADGAPFARLHVTAAMKPGVSGGALVDEAGNLVAIAVGGGEGRYEAIPVSGVRTLLEARFDETAEAVTQNLGAAYTRCSEGLETLSSGARSNKAREAVVRVCSTAQNQGQLLEAGRLLARLGDLDNSVAILGMAVDRVPNSVNARLSLLAALQLSARFTEMIDHIRWLLRLVPDDPQALRFAIQAGVWGGEPNLAEDGYKAMLKVDPRQAEAARQFIDNAPPTPKRR